MIEQDGWVMVPREPTPEMLKAAVKMREGPAVYKIMSEGGLRTLEAEAADEYAAMLSAIPEAPAHPEFLPPLPDVLPHVAMLPGSPRLYTVEQMHAYRQALPRAAAGYDLGFAHGVRFADESLTGKDIIPEAPAPSEPLTDEQIDDIWAGCSDATAPDMSIHLFAHAVLAAASTPPAPPIWEELAAIGKDMPEAPAVPAPTTADGSLTVDEAVDGVLSLYPGANKQALRRLAQLMAKPAAVPAPQEPAEPVAWGLMKPDGTVDHDLIGLKADCEYWTRAENETQSGWKVVPLFLHPPAVPAVPLSQPLTVRQIDHLWARAGTAGIGDRPTYSRKHEFARAVEAAHGIGASAQAPQEQP